MKRSPLVYLFLLLVIVVLACLTRPARAAEGTAGAVSAGGSGGAGIGVGASAFVSGFSGAQVVFDQPKWHIEALMAFKTNRDTGTMNSRQTFFNFGVSAWYHLALGASSDFSLGGGFALLTQSGRASANAEVVEPGAQIRAFVTSNVAIHALIAFPLVFGDDVGTPTGGVNNSVGFNGQILAAFGFTYFFR